MDLFNRYLFFFFILWAIPMVGNTQDPNTPVPYTLADRDRMIRLESEMSLQKKELMFEIKSLRNETKSEINALRNETKSEINALRNEVTILFESQQRQIEDFKNVFFWSTGIIVSIILVLFGFILWDRHTMMKPFYQQNQTTILSLEKLKSAFKEVGQKNPDIKEALEKQGLV